MPRNRDETFTENIFLHSRPGWKFWRGTGHERTGARFVLRQLKTKWKLMEHEKASFPLRNYHMISIVMPSQPLNRQLNRAELAQEKKSFFFSWNKAEKMFKMQNQHL